MSNALRLAVMVLPALFPFSSAAQSDAPAPPPAAATDTALDEAKDAIRASDWPAALAASERVLAANGEDVVANYIAGTSLLRLGRLDDAQTRLSAVERLAPTFPGLNFQLGYLLYSRAESFGQAGDDAQARPLYRKAAERFATELERSPDQIASLSSRATALGKAGDVEAAIAAHELWAAAEPASNGPLLSLGGVLAMAGRADGAAAVLERLPVDDAVTKANAALTLGSLLYELDPATKALPLLGRALESPPTRTNAQGKIVGVHAKSLKLDATADALKTFLELNPSQNEAEQVGELIREKFTSAADGLAPHIERLATPRYPKQARQNNITTEVLVLAKIATDGKVVETIVVPNRIWLEIRSLGFEEAAFDAVRRSRFEPGIGADGKPVEKWAIAKISFEP